MTQSLLPVQSCFQVFRGLVSLSTKFTAMSRNLPSIYNLYNFKPLQIGVLLVTILTSCVTALLVCLLVNGQASVSLI